MAFQNYFSQMGIAAKLFGHEEPRGYYEMQKHQFQMPQEVQRLDYGNGECQRITKLNARSYLGVRIL